MAQFRVEHAITLVVKDRPNVCVIGEVVDGVIRTGMLAQLHRPPKTPLVHVIADIEIACGEDGCRPALRFSFDTPQGAGAWQDALAAGVVLECAEGPA